MSASFLFSGVAFCQNRSLSLNGGVSVMNLVYQTHYPGDRPAIGVRGGVAYNYTLNPHWELGHTVEFAQAGNNYLKFYPTGVLDTVYVYNSIQIYEHKERMSYVRLGSSLRRLNLTKGPIKLYAGISLYTGLLINATSSRNEVGGSRTYRINDYADRQKFVLGIEPEIGIRIYMVNGKYFSVSLSREHGVASVFANQ